MESTAPQLANGIHVVVGTRGGEYISSTAPMFNPDQSLVVTEGGEREFTPEKLAFIAFPDHDVSTPTQARLVRVHLDGGWQLEVELIEQDESRRGYYCRSTSSTGSLYFYEDAVIEMHDVEPATE